MLLVNLTIKSIMVIATLRVECCKWTDDRPAVATAVTESDNHDRQDVEDPRDRGSRRSRRTNRAGRRATHSAGRTRHRAVLRDVGSTWRLPLRRRRKPRRRGGT